MQIPLLTKLKKRMHRDLAMLQDELLEVTYSSAPNAVLHGGTAVWRCYNGNRFSENLNFYLTGNKTFKQTFTEQINARGLELLKFKETENTVFSKISNGTTEMLFEAALRKPKSFEVKQYERADGTTVDVFTLSPEELLLEKITAYTNRKLIRDIYDVYHLSAIADCKKVKKELQQLLSNPPKPLDEKNLRALVYVGAVPSFSQVVSVLKIRCLK